MQKHSSYVSCLHGKMPNMMKLNTLECAKMLLMHRGACGMVASKKIHRKCCVKAASLRLVCEGELQWDQPSDTTSAATATQKKRL